MNKAHMTSTHCIIAAAWPGNKLSQTFVLFKSWLSNSALSNPMILLNHRSAMSDPALYLEITLHCLNTALYLSDPAPTEPCTIWPCSVRRLGELLEFIAMLVDPRLKMLFRPACLVLVAVPMRWYHTQVILHKHITHVPRQLSRKYQATVSAAGAGGSTYISRLCFDKCQIFSCNGTSRRGQRCSLLVGVCGSKPLVVVVVVTSQPRSTRSVNKSNGGKTWVLTELKGLSPPLNSKFWAFLERLGTWNANRFHSFHAAGNRGSIFMFNWIQGYIYLKGKRFRREKNYSELQYFVRKISSVAAKSFRRRKISSYFKDLWDP